MEFKWELSIGTITLIITILGIYAHMAYRLGKLEQKLNIMYTWFEKNVFGQVPDRVKSFFGEQDR